MRTILLTKISTSTARNSFADTDDVGEPQARVEAGSPVAVNVEAIRCFYPRRDQQPGTRLTFIDGGGFAVIESFDVVQAAVVGENSPI